MIRKSLRFLPVDTTGDFLTPRDEESRAVNHNESDRTDRRAFLQAGTLATASALATGTGLGAQEAAPKSSELPRRPLGKTGVDVTILDMGTGKGPDVDRLLRFGFA